MIPRKRFAPIVLIVLLWLVVAACAAPAPTAAPAASAPRVVEKVITQVVEKQVVAPAKAPAPTQAPAAADKSASADTAGNVSLDYSETRKIIKNGELNLLVADTDRTVDRVTSIAADSGGYIISSQTTVKAGFKYASLTLGVPVEQFEAVQRQLRGLALEVQSDTASGKDVTDEYVDLQSRLANLEATQARIREFLARANTVEEALKVNAQLTEIEGQIAQVKGRLNYLGGRAAFSTIAVNLEPQRPTPTPSPTPTVTPTPTPAVWRPGETFQDATGTLGTMLRGFGDLLIWLVIVVLPFVLLLGLIIAFVAWLLRKLRRRTPPKANG
ncbi:MAG: DUF4349 domain-containing protein [Chloroflexi bacterium]|nr:DUF4349 domain-containing protein [Chloroflexota bacterium]